MEETSNLVANERDSLTLIYHQFEPAAAQYTYAMPIHRFREHIGAICGIAESATHYKPQITFDDGHRSQLEHALPMLGEYDLPAHFFITTGWMGQSGFMDTVELREIAATHKIGTHGMTHKLLTHCSPAELEDELGASKRMLEDAVGREVSSVSMPGGRYNRRVLQACAAAGYTDVFTSDPVPGAESRLGMSVWGRYNVLQSLRAEQLLRLLDRFSHDLRRQRLYASAKRTARALSGDRIYELLWSYVARQK